jgi:multicomponent Na+:H+ antiporter subunit A
MLVGGYRALRQTDIKLILAYGTVSQLGFLTMVVGLGTPDAALAGLAMLLAHGLFKATLFLVVGIIDHQSGTRDVRKLSGVFRSSRALGIVAAIGAASMAGVPLLGGFVAKESVLEAFVHYAGNADAGWPLGHGGPGRLVIGSVLTFAYSARFMWGAFATKSGRGAHALQGHQALFPGRARHPEPPDHRLRPLAGPVDAWIQPYAALFAEGPRPTPAPQPSRPATWRCGTASPRHWA